VIPLKERGETPKAFAKLPTRIAATVNRKDGKDTNDGVADIDPN